MERNLERDNDSKFMSLLMDIEHGLPLPPPPVLHSPESEETVQNSQFLKLPEKIITRILSFVPLIERVTSTLTVCRTFRQCAKRSVTCVNFFQDSLDILSDRMLVYFLQVYGKHVTSLNFDLFRSTCGQGDDDKSQWQWRQLVVACVRLCSNVSDITVLVCNRHRLRDTDLQKIFEEAPNLVALSIDAQYINGHSLKTRKQPTNLERLELEVAVNFTPDSLRALSRYTKLTALYLSKLIHVNDAFMETVATHLTKLTEVYLISDQKTACSGLSVRGVLQIFKLPRLEHLSLEGLAQVTDGMLSELTGNLGQYPATNTITSLSLSHCFNISSAGLQCLSRISRLAHLNLDAVSKRDLSLGLEKMAKEGRLVTLMMADKTNVSPETLVKVVQTSPRLRLLDISDNEEVINWHSANALVNYRTAMAMSGPTVAPLTILTNNHGPWTLVPRPRTRMTFSKQPVIVYYLQSASVPDNPLGPESVLSNESINNVPPYLLMPRLRRADLFRWGLDVNVDSHTQANSGLMPTTLSPPPPFQSENLHPPMNHMTNNIGPIRRGSKVQLSGPAPPPLLPPPFLLPPGAPPNLNMNFPFPAPPGIHGRGLHPAGGIPVPPPNMSRPPPFASMENGNRPLDWNAFPPQQRHSSLSVLGAKHAESDFSYENCAPAEMLQPGNNVSIPNRANDENAPPPPTFLPDGFSCTPISDSNDPQTRDWSLDVLTLLMRTHAFPDGARVGPITCKEGLAFLPNGQVRRSVSPPAPYLELGAMKIDEVLTSGSGGAPRPPIDIPEVPIVHHNRGRRAKRRSGPKPAPKPSAVAPKKVEPQAPVFCPDDFPPL